MNQKANPQGFGADFGAYVPGFDFLQKLVQGDPQALYANWIAPTLDPKVLEQRISELKAVQFWLEQNATALKATLQALEVQKMTLAALRSMGAPMPDAGASTGAPSSSPPPLMADAMQYWGALTQQFQTIAAQAMKDVAARGAAAPQADAPAAGEAAPPAPKRSVPKKTSRKAPDPGPAS